MSLRYRFFKKLDKIKCKNSDSCWEWVGDIDKGGYGRILGEEKGRSGYRKKVFAHRVCYEMFKGNIPDKMFVLHSCDNPRCVNPNHLRIGTHQDNMDDMKRRGRTSITSKTYCKTCGNDFIRDRFGRRRCTFCEEERARFKKNGIEYPY